MSERHHLRDRTLILRVLVPSLETRLRDKMKMAEEQAKRAKKPAAGDSSSSSALSFMDLDGVTCEPSRDGSTLWNFHCDGAVYPGRLVNLPCPVELHKTHDHAVYFKSVDVAQLLIVYEDRMEMEEAEAAPGYKSESFPSYYHSGLTPPMKRVVERRYEARDHKAVPPPRLEVQQVEDELITLIERVSKDSGKGSGRGKKSSNNSTVAHKVIEEVVEDVVDYEPWMDDYGRTPYGIEIDEKDIMCSKHPELWIDTQEVAKIKKEQTEKEDAAKKKKEEKAAKKKEKKAKKAQEEAAAAKKPSVKKGIPAKKNMEPLDEVGQAAAQMSQEMDDEDFLEYDLGFSFDGDDKFEESSVVGINLDDLS